MNSLITPKYTRIKCQHLFLGRSNTQIHLPFYNSNVNNFSLFIALLTGSETQHENTILCVQIDKIKIMKC